MYWVCYFEITLNIHWVSGKLRPKTPDSDHWNSPTTPATAVRGPQFTEAKQVHVRITGIKSGFH